MTCGQPQAAAAEPPATEATPEIPFNEAWAQAGQWWGSMMNTFQSIAQQAQEDVLKQQADFMKAQEEAAARMQAEADARAEKEAAAAKEAAAKAAAPAPVAPAPPVAPPATAPASQDVTNMDDDAFLAQFAKR